MYLPVLYHNFVVFTVLSSKSVETLIFRITSASMLIKTAVNAGPLTCEDCYKKKMTMFKDSVLMN